MRLRSQGASLREATRDDILDIANTLRGNKRHHTVVALRSLFAYAKKTGIIFRNPTARIPAGPNTYTVLQPLPDRANHRSSQRRHHASRPADPLAGRDPRRPHHRYRPAQTR